MNDLKITLKRNRSPSNSSNSSSFEYSTVKKPKMDPISMEQFVDKINQSFDIKLDALRKNLKADMENNLKDIKVTLNDQEDRLRTMEGQVAELNQRVGEGIGKEEVLCSIKKDLDEDMKSIKRIALLKEIDSCKHDLIAFSSDISKTAAQIKESIYETLSGGDQVFSDPFSVKDLSSNKSGSQNKSKMFLLNFQTIASRNNFLNVSSKLPRFIRIEKSVPKLYLPKYKEFKGKSWKLRSLKGFQTSIGFMGINLQLKYRKDRSHSFVIHEEFCPTLNEISPKIKEPSQLEPPTKLIDKDELEKLNRTIIWPSRGRDMDIETAKTSLEEFLEGDDMKLVWDIKVGKGCFLLLINTVDNAQNMALKYKDKLYNGQKMNWSLGNV